jgi:imidazolonepropionase-like amidohydrolase
MTASIPTWLTNARVIDGLGVITERATVELDGGRIVAIHEGESPSAPPDAQVLDVAGRTVMPGLIDVHVHLSSYDHLPPILRGEAPRPPELRTFELANGARSFLAGGVTTVRDVGSEEDHALLLREAVRLGLCPGPRILTCARIISATAPGGVTFGSMYRGADGPDDMRKAVREQLRRGADYIKIMSTGARSVVYEDPEPAQVTRDELAALVDEAHRMGRKVAAHAEGLGGARLAIDEGADTIEHGLSLHRAPDLLDAMATKGIVLVPTLTTFHDVAAINADHYPTVLVEQAKRQRDDAYLTIVAAHAAGVPLALGFDSWPPGADAMELVRMVEAGIPAMDALVAATRGGAVACGIDDLGVVAPGAAADLLVVDGDPLADVAVLADPDRIHLVLQAGVPVAGPAGPAEPPR